MYDFLNSRNPNLPGNHRENDGAPGWRFPLAVEHPLKREPFIRCIWGVIIKGTIPRVPAFSL